MFQAKASDVIQFPLSQNSRDLYLKLSKYLEIFQYLDELWAADLLEATGENTWRIPYRIYKTLGSEDLEEAAPVMGLPQPTAPSFFVKAKFHVGHAAFDIEVEYEDPAKGTVRVSKNQYHDGVIFLGKESILPLDEKGRDLLDAVTGHFDADSIESRMEHLAKVRNAALAAGAKLDPYLSREIYDFHDSAALDFQMTAPDEILLEPRLMDGKNGEPGTVLREEDVRHINTQAGAKGERRRRVLDKGLRKSLKELPPEMKITGSDVPKFLTNPEQVVPEGLDLSLFSERVKGIRTKVYNSKPYLQVKRSDQEGWFEGIPGVKLEDWSPQEAEGPGETLSSGGTTKNLSPETLKKLARKAKETGEEYILHEGDWIRIDPEGLDAFEKLTDPLEKGDKGALKIPAGAMLDIYENIDTLDYVHEHVFRDDTTPHDGTPQPSSLKAQLYPYQLEGYRWMNGLAGCSRGGLLADDMGLGKTIQVISHMLYLKEEGIDATHLVVVPKSLLENWRREIQKFSDGVLTCYLYDGIGRIFNPSLTDRFDVIVITYDTLRRDQAVLATHDWNMVVCDEAQYAKNPTTQRTCAVKALKANHRIALTGTPVENGLIEFWCIMDFVQPGLLGSWKEFRTTYERPIVTSEIADSQVHVDRLLEQINGYYKRRMKKDVMKDLPPCNAIYREVEMGSQQFEMYKTIVGEAKAGGKGAALAAIQKLIMLSAHPTAIYPDGESGEKHLEISPKLKATCEIIRDIKDRSDKVIIFSDFKKIQKVLQKTIQKEFGIMPDIINGEVNTNRQTIIDIFSEKKGFNVLILGHQVAGVGLNIISANHVIHYTRPWNPAKERQATDRAYRIGQIKPVTVYYPIVTHPEFTTVEKKLDDLLRSKQDLAENVLRPTSEAAVKEKDMFECLNMESA
ncbi:DEAD/DEAH box helicase [Desulfoluna sp.]|uniref:DEAD/DEAH box helicase n=1 Tax=Desulfoluna sp. TaxID=2045199 RepID=UPI00261AF3E3|nr:DEAD/DEAH box helicase [Desulfoluna sp.]